MNDNVIQIPVKSDADKLIDACEGAGVNVYVKTDNTGGFPLFELYQVTDPEKAIKAMMALSKKSKGSERFRIDLTNYAFAVGSTVIEGYIEPPLWIDDKGHAS